MQPLNKASSFGGTDADNDDILLQAFEDHESYLDIINFRRHMIIGKKGSGKTAIFKKLITSKSHDIFSFGHTFLDYPWHHHLLQARVNIPDNDKYTHSWKYLILLSAAKVALNQDNSLPLECNIDEMQKLEAFVVDTYGSRDPDLSQIFVPTKKLRLKPYLELDATFIKAGIKPENITIAELPTIVQEVNSALTASLLSSLNPEHTYFIAFDQLDLGFDIKTSDYANKLIGLLLAARDINLAAKEAGKKLFIVIFLRDDIYDYLHFEDKNKMTENFVSVIEWDTPRARKTLKMLMERRFSIVLASRPEESVSWNQVFNEDREMPGHQSKYNHIIDRTYLRPRDIIKFTNCALDRFKRRFSESGLDVSSEIKIENEDIHNSREEYSNYFLEEIDDEVRKHIPDYEKYLDILRKIGNWNFTREEFDAIYEVQKGKSDLTLDVILEALYSFSFIGFYRLGGRGYGGSEIVFKYRESRTRFDPRATRFRIHPGLIEVMGLKRK